MLKKSLWWICFVECSHSWTHRGARRPRRSGVRDHRDLRFGLHRLCHGRRPQKGLDRDHRAHRHRVYCRSQHPRGRPIQRRVHEPGPLLRPSRCQRRLLPKLDLLGGPTHRRRPCWACIWGHLYWVLQPSCLLWSLKGMPKKEGIWSMGFWCFSCWFESFAFLWLWAFFSCGCELWLVSLFYPLKRKRKRKTYLLIRIILVDGKWIWNFQLWYYSVLFISGWCFCFTTTNYNVSNDHIPILWQSRKV